VINILERITIASRSARDRHVQSGYEDEVVRRAGTIDMPVLRAVCSMRVGRAGRRFPYVYQGAVMGSAVGIAVGIGIAVAIQVAVVGQASRVAHPLAISFGLQISGLLVGAVWIVQQRTWSDVWDLTFEWWWLPLGALGWGIVAALGFSAARLGAGPTLAIVVAAQIITALGLDRLTGQVTLNFRHLLGIVLLVAGVVLISALS